MDVQDFELAFSMAQLHFKVKKIKIYIYIYLSLQRVISLSKFSFYETASLGHQ